MMELRWIQRTRITNGVTYWLPKTLQFRDIDYAADFDWKDVPEVTDEAR